MRWLVLALVSSTLIACVGDGSVGPVDGGADATSDVGLDVQQPDVTQPDAGVDAPIVCDGGATVMACGSTCVDVATSGTNCGACGHDCGGGQCKAGTCQPMVVVDSLDHPPFDVDGSYVYYPAGSSMLDLVKCASSGCLLTPTTIASPGAVYTTQEGGDVLLFAKNVAFYGEVGSNPGRARLFACDPVGGCSTNPVTVRNAGLQSFGSDTAVSGTDLYWTYYKSLEHVSCPAPNTCGTPEQLVTLATTWPRVGLSADSSGVYYIDTTHTLVKCPVSGACTPTTMLAGLGTGAQTTMAYGGNVYVLDSAASGYLKGTIHVCPNSGACTPSTFVDTQPWPTLMWVDAQGVYWFNGDTGDIKTCPLTGCKPSPRTLASSQAPLVLRSDAKFLYWSTATQILRVAK